MESTAILNTQYQVEKARTLRKKGTKAEKILWEALRNRKVKNLKFRRQHPLSNYIADFCCEEKRLIIEIDGSIHDIEENKEYDGIRQDELENAGYTIIRFKNDDVLKNLPYVIRKIGDTVANLPSPQRRGAGGEEKSP